MLRAAVAQREQADFAIKSAEADVQRLQAILHDLVLVAPRSGRGQYKLARAGEVVSAGRRVLTILDLSDVYMTIFLPAAQAGVLKIGDEARVILDPAPQYVVPARISFVAADAQFMPKTVETRELLEYRFRDGGWPVPDRGSSGTTKPLVRKEALLGVRADRA